MGMSTKYPKKVEKMSDKCPKIVQRAENTMSGHFFNNFGLLGPCFFLVTLSNACPLRVGIWFRLRKGGMLRRGARKVLKKSLQTAKARPLGKKPPLHMSSTFGQFQMGVTLLGGRTFFLSDEQMTHR